MSSDPNFVAVPRDNVSRQLILMIRATSTYLTNVVQHHSNPLDCLILPYELSKYQGQYETPALKTLISPDFSTKRIVSAMDGSDQGRPPPTPKSRTKPIQRPPGLWFEDGNHVIQAGSYQFRIHRSILSARSPVLQRVFSVLVPEGRQSIEGCPVAHLQDHGKIVMHFLLAIYDPA